MTSETFDICTVGSCNMDLACRVQNQPNKGETIHGHSFSTNFGGKGANQSVIGAKLGGKSAFVGMVGNDANGQSFKKEFEKENIDISHLYTSDCEATGIALITVDDKGENQIVVCLGANNKLTKANIDDSEKTIKCSKTLIAQLENDPDVVLYSMQMAKNHGVKTIFNPAPSPEVLDPEFIKATDFLVVNESEATMISKIEVVDVESAKKASLELVKQGCGNVLLTLGGDGIVVYTSDQESNIENVVHIPGVNVSKVVDTSGAGDCFIGSFAYFYCNLKCESFNKKVITAVERANQVAAASVQKFGTQMSYPSKEELPESLFNF